MSNERIIAMLKSLKSANNLELGKKIVFDSHSPDAWLMNDEEHLNYALFVYTSRFPSLIEIENAIRKMGGMLGLNLKKGYKFDLVRPRAKIPYSGLLLKFFFIFMRYGLLTFLRTGKFELSSCRAFERYFKVRKIKTCFLFTENSRIVEYARIALINQGIRHFVFLHGITSNYFENYYNNIYASYDVVRFVNIHADLPQPKICEQRMLYIDGKQVVFNNDVPIKLFPSSAYLDCKKVKFVIIGSDIAQGNYVDSALFEFDIKLINYLVENRLDFVYCPHPRLHNNFSDLLPEKAELGEYGEYLGQYSVFIGHQSTALLKTKILGYPTYISDLGFNMIGANNQKVFHQNDILSDTHFNNKISNCSFSFLNDGKNLCSKRTLEL